MWGSAALLATTTTSIIKHVTRDSPSRILKRPEGARDCNAWNNDGDQSGQPGFPSGHAATAAAFWFYAWRLAPPVWRPWIAGAGMAATGLMGWARWAKRCHTVFQIAGGIVVGTGVAATAYIYTN
jgi:membrane-associated phospholipid phosphatase